MNEFFASNRLSAYIDGELSESEMAEVERAIRENPTVRAEYSRMMNAIELVRNQGVVEVPQGFRARLDARLAVERMPQARWRWIPSPLRRMPLEAFGLACAALLVVFLIQREPPTAETQENVEVETVAQESEPSFEEDTPTEESETAGVLLETLEKKPVVEKARKKESAKVRKKGQVSKDRKSAPKKKELQEKNIGVADFSKSDPLPDLGINWEDDYEQAGGTRGHGKSKKEEEASRNPRYRLNVVESDVLWQLEKLASKFGAQLLSSSGRKISPESMTTENNYKNIRVKIQGNQLTGFAAALQDLGAITLVHAGGDQLYGGGDIVLELGIQYEP